MFKIIFLLGLGIAIGYFMGFGDAQKHDKNVVIRLVERAGGAARDKVGNDIDARMNKATGTGGR